MTSTHGIILAAIGLAMFAILAVVWVLRRAQSVRAAIRNFRIVQEPPAPYASPITGTGSRPVNPLEERIVACELDIAGLAQRIAPLDAIIRDVADTKARLDALESKRPTKGCCPNCDGAGMIPIVCLASETSAVSYTKCITCHVCKGTGDSRVRPRIQGDAE